MNTVIGNLQKMKARSAIPVDYSLVVDQQEIPLNQHLGSIIHIDYSGVIHCIQCGRQTRKSFQQGYCFPCMQRLNECGNCIIHPEKCKVEAGSCCKEDWAHAHCDQEHLIYLANTSGLKVGITRHSQGNNQGTSRWIDQGAVQAIPVFRVKNRYQSGLIEMALKKHVRDKTDWRLMLRCDPEPLDLQQQRDHLLVLAESDLAEIMRKYRHAVQLVEAAEDFNFNYPMISYPQKIMALSLDKTPQIQGKLLGIKGQYLVLDIGVINIRKFSGYQVEVSFKRV